MGLAINKIIDKKNKKIIWEINPEGVRLYAYLCFWLLVIIGAWLTIKYSNVDFQNNPLFHMFGYNNICILFDAYPSTYVIQSIWVINYLLLTCYIITSWLRIYEGYLISIVTNLDFTLFSISSGIELISIILFTTVFSVTPEESMFFHIGPFTFLILALSLLAIKNYIYYNRIADLTKNEKILGLLYLAIHLFASLFKISMQINGLSGDYFYNTMAYVGFHQFIDRLWMVTAALLPIYFSLRLRNRISNLVYYTKY